MARHANRREAAAEAADILGGPDPGAREDVIGGREADPTQDTLGGADPGGREDVIGGREADPTQDTLGGADPRAREDVLAPPDPVSVAERHEDSMSMASRSKTPTDQVAE